MKKNTGFTIFELLIAVGFLFVLALVPLLALWTGRNLDFWLTHFKGHTVHVPFWLDLVATVVLNGIIVGANIISEIVRLAM